MNILITGAAGYIGSQLVQKLEKKISTEEKDWRIVATDIRDQPAYIPDVMTDYHKMDVRAPEFADFMQSQQIDTVVHLATIVTPGKKSNREFEYSVDVLGTQNVLDACVATGVKRIVVTSSGAAYGYRPDNPEWLVETDPLRGNEEFAYSHHKRLVEKMMADYRIAHPELEQIIFRIGTILGKNVNNQITALFEKPVVLGIRGSESPFVFIWDQDVVACLIQAISNEQTGIFNVAGDGAVTITDLSRLLGKKTMRLPAGVVKNGLFVLKRLNLTQYGEEQLNFLRYRPVLDNTRLKKEFGFTPTFTSRQVFENYIAKAWPGE
ncbi:SDR family oxidoreductase [Planococcus sp. 107-1]|uniref:SDR family oxidoreductase n=1 Tax=Planococcus sp. 107-1 TaxID=2908840 RepID=UPI001F37A146|nr:SDR family oxidoreductase [Planococcus sp. 107-1]UJF27622.1 SDR family oxidoreductase [Planococcus sp. 107-1]